MNEEATKTEVTPKKAGRPSSKDRMDKLEEKIDNLNDMILALADKLIEVENKKVTVSSTGTIEQETESVLLGDEVSFENVGPIPVDGNGKPLNMPKADPNNIRVVNDGGVTSIIDASEVNKDNEINV